MAAKLKIQIQATPETKRALRMLTQQWGRRFDAFSKQFLYSVAEETRANVAARIPTQDPVDKDYKSSLKTATIVGAPGVRAAYAITSVPKSKELSKIRKSQRGALIYIRAKKGSVSARLLERYNPWTMDTLPFNPPSAEADIIYRPATVAEMTVVSKQRTLQLPKVSASLRRAGGQSIPKLASPSGRKLVAVPDYTRQALQREFGVGPVRAKPHWRPALINFTRKDLPYYFQSRITPQRYQLALSLLDPTFSQWTSWPTKTPFRITPGRANAFAVFQSKVRPSGVTG